MLLIEMKWVSILLILAITVLGGWWPFRHHARAKDNAFHDFPLGESLAAGIFFAAGLLHLLPDAANDFFQAGYHYPFAFLIAGGSFLLLLLLEHVSLSLQHEKSHAHHPHQHVKKDLPLIAYLTVAMLSIHSLLEGTAVGVAQNWANTLVIVMAILAHKGAAAFALSVSLNRSQLKPYQRYASFCLFALMTPLGIFLGNVISTQTHTLSEPIFTALAAGTFIYIGTLHGLDRASLIRHCCNMKEFFMMLFGFSVMAVVAWWV